ncbi:hypothetical protein HaLaN_24479, partial [Haematococcus lacustris]
SLSRAARASPEAFPFRCASVRSGCSASSRSSMSLSGSSGTGLGTVRLLFLAIENSNVSTLSGKNVFLTMSRQAGKHLAGKHTCSIPAACTATHLQPTAAAHAAHAFVGQILFKGGSGSGSPGPLE